MKDFEKPLLSAALTRPYNAAMLVRDIGEFELITLLESRIRERNRVQIEKSRALGVDVELEIGDDAAAWRQTSAARIVSTMDTTVEGDGVESERRCFGSMYFTLTLVLSQRELIGVCISPSPYLSSERLEARKGLRGVGISPSP